MCIYGSASFLSSCLSSNTQQWTISPQSKRESNSKKGARYNPLCFVAFRKHHRSHSVIPVHHHDNSSVTISVTPLCISLFFTWLKGGNVSSSLRSGEGLCFLSLPLLVAEVREYISWFPPTEGNLHSVLKYLLIKVFFLSLQYTPESTPVIFTPASCKAQSIYPSPALPFSIGKMGLMTPSRPKTRWMKRSFLEVCLKQRQSQVKHSLSMKHSLKIFASGICLQVNSFVGISQEEKHKKGVYVAHVIW